MTQEERTGVPLDRASLRGDMKTFIKCLRGKGNKLLYAEARMKHMDFNCSKKSNIKKLI